MSGVIAWPKRLGSLTGARFVAAAMVFVHHSVGPDNIPIVDLGYLGVTFFFVLSGFVLTWAGSADRGVLVSYRNRFARIYPLHILTLLIAIALPGWYVVNTPGMFVQNLLLLQSWTPSGSSSFNWVAWSISNEAFFYLLFPFALIVLRRCGPRLLLVVAVSVWATQGIGGLLLNARFPDPGTIFYVTYIFPPFRFAEFLIGMCLALYLRSGARISRGTALVGIAAAVAGVVGTVGVDFGSGTTRNVIILMALPATVAIIAGLVLWERAGGAGVFRNPVMVRLGEWSFAFYMVHALVIRVAAWLLGLPAPGYMPLWSIPPTFAASVLLAWMAHRYVERPIERILRTKREEGRKPGAETSSKSVLPDHANRQPSPGIAFDGIRP